MTEVSISVAEPYYSQIVKGTKTVEGRLAKSKYLAIKPGDVFIINEKTRAGIKSITYI